MNPPRILIAGIGNIFMGDDAFGCEVAQRLAALAWPEGVRVVDFGIRGMDLAYAMLEEYDSVILVDAVPRGGVPRGGVHNGGVRDGDEFHGDGSGGGEPGAVYVIEIDPSELGGGAPEDGAAADGTAGNAARQGMLVETHGMHPLKVLGMVNALGGKLRRLLLVGCEPRDLGSPEEGKMGLSEPVAAAIPEAIACVTRLVSKALVDLNRESK